ncbi:MAG: HipA domain-containing protein [Sphingomonas sp.]|uniref:HipA domain-containing protein n=1 Tax=Sphingomonas sp. TaxID=28214 RepID=UPI0025FA05A4|nr:HipA domain-containing protein [Sphingomonas sp.]MBY0285229.1 HipA domain-containing protein [Sphingomonas sp.]
MPASDALLSPIDISLWREDEEFGIHPYGSKAKRTLICPDAPDNPLLIAGHRYLYKQAESWKAQQMWSEAVAYQIGAAAGLPVPPCFVASNAADGTTGALIEFFYGYPGQDRADRLAHGADILQGAGLMDGSGQPHFLRVNLQHCEDVGIAGASDWWARVIGFDALIGNTDRHSQNWGLLVDQEGAGRMAPMFDNGTSLAYQIKDVAIAAGIDADAYARFVRKGRHSCRWAGDDLTAYDHIGLAGRFLEARPGTAPAMRAAVAIGDGELEGFLHVCSAIDIEPRFTAGRADMVGRLVRMRRDLLGVVLDQYQ